MQHCVRYALAIHPIKHCTRVTLLSLIPLHRSLTQYKEYALSDSNHKWIKEFCKRLRMQSAIKYKGMDVETLVLRRISVLEHLTCSPYQILEWPGFVDLQEQQIHAAVDRLTVLGVEKPSVLLIKLASLKYRNSDSALGKRIKKHQLNLQGCNSYTEFWQQKLKLTEGELEALVIKNHRLIAGKDISNVLEKLHILQQHGVSLDIIKDNNHILKNQSLKVIKSRLEEVKPLKLDGPSTVSLIMQYDKVYQRMLKNKIEDTQRMVMLTKILNVPANLIMKRQVLMQMPVHLLRKKLEYLVLECGFSGIEVVDYDRVLTYGLPKLKQTVHDLQHGGHENLTLPLIVNYASSQHYTSRRSTPQRVLASLLSCEPDEIRLETFQQKRAMQGSIKHAVANFTLLTEWGFSRDVIRQCPLVLGHDTSTLEVAWKTLPLALVGDYEQDDINDLLESLSVKLLNLLQYHIERTYNFPMIVVQESGD